MNLDLLIAAVKPAEGTGPVKNGRFMPYRDTVGKLTIGWGRNLDDTGITEDEAEYLLAGDIHRSVAELRAVWPWFDSLADARQRALAEMNFEMGLAVLLQFKDTIRFVQAGDYDAAAKAALQSKWANQVGARAVRIAAMLRTGLDA
jgi:lysozyme